MSRHSRVNEEGRKKGHFFWDMGFTLWHTGIFFCNFSVQQAPELPGSQKNCQTKSQHQFLCLVKLYSHPNNQSLRVLRCDRSHFGLTRTWHCAPQLKAGTSYISSQNLRYYIPSRSALFTSTDYPTELSHSISYEIPYMMLALSPRAIISIDSHNSLRCQYAERG